MGKILIHSLESYPEELANYFVKIKEVYDIGLKNLDFGNYYNEIVYKIKEVGFKKSREIDDLDKAREYFEACCLYHRIEDAFNSRYQIKERLDFLQLLCTSPIESVLLGLQEIIEDPEVISVIFKSDNERTRIERQNEHFFNVVELLRKKIKGEEVVDEIKNEIDTLVGFLTKTKENE